MSKFEFISRNPPLIFHANGTMRGATGKSTLKKNIRVDVPQRLIMSPTAIVMEVSATIWTLEWPSHETVATFILGFKIVLTVQLSEAQDVLTGITTTPPQKLALDLTEQHIAVSTI